MKGVPFLERITLADFLAGHFAAARKGPLKDDAVNGMDVGDRLAVPFGDDPRPAAYVSLPKPATYAKVKDPAAFLRWVKKHLPDEVETVPQVREGTRRALLDQAKANSGKWVSPDGELVAIDGVEVQAGDPAPRVELTGDAAEVIAKAWQAGLIDLAPMLALPAPGGEE